jgi:hypothetical protein
MHSLHDVVQTVLSRRPMLKVRALSHTIDPQTMRVRTITEEFHAGESPPETVNCPACRDSGVVSVQDEREVWLGLRCHCGPGQKISEQCSQISRELWLKIINNRTGRA